MAVKPGDTCPECRKARLRTYSSRPMSATQQVRYIECPACGHRTKAIVPAEFIYRRSFYVETTLPK